MQAKPPDQTTSRLPPIVNGRGSALGCDKPSTSKADEGQRIQNHRARHLGCRPKESLYMDWNSTKPEKKKAVGKSVKHPPRSSSLASFKDAEHVQITRFLDCNKIFLENYIMENIPMQTVERWLHRKLEQIEKVSPESPYEMDFRPYNGKYNKKDMFMEVLKSLSDEPTERQVVWALACGISAEMRSEIFRLFKITPDQRDHVHYFVNNSESPYLTPSTLSKIKFQSAPHVFTAAEKQICLRLSRHLHEEEYPSAPMHLFLAYGVKDEEYTNNVMYMPLLQKSGETAYVLELWRDTEFQQCEEDICSNLIVWGSITLHYCSAKSNKKQENNMSNFLLTVARAIFNEMISFDLLIKKILEFAQQLVCADRASLFLIDSRNFELVSTFFDLKFEEDFDKNMQRKEVRIPISRGIAGYVAQSGETMNIPDAYSDYRFNSEVDEATGYKTISILCMPIKVEGRTIGVVQMVNKRGVNTTFTYEDEVHFEIFATFFGLALHHARLYDKIIRKEQKYRVALEVLSYHNTSSEIEAQKLLDYDLDICVSVLNDFYLDPYKFPEMDKCKAIIKMFGDLFDIRQFDLRTMTRFVLTVKKNYRRVPYHNFDHGWSVAHAMYVILKHDDPQRLEYKMRLALFVACLCHDLDHRGYTNKYMNDTASPLAAIYTTSTLEHHHFNITVTILQQEGHNIFGHMDTDEYKEMLGLIRQCILATDLAVFFPNLDRLRVLCSEESGQKFDWNIINHRDLAMAISMTAADLSASSKPWDIQNKTVKVIFEEFYAQGDKERAAGREPIPMMDRTKPEEQPSSQVGFLSTICIPCYDMLYTILPKTKPMLIMAVKNLDRWQARANRVVRTMKREKQKAADLEKRIDNRAEDLVSQNDEEDGANKAEADPFLWDEEEEMVVGRFQDVKRNDSNEISWLEEEYILVNGVKK